MIQVSRGDAPLGFLLRSRQWQQRFTAERAGNPTLTASAFWKRIRAEIRTDGQELYRRFNRKCVFCESRVEHISRPHIEHYRPKGRREFEHLMFVWSNWLSSCGRCNEKKWKHFPLTDDIPSLIDPASEDGSQHIRFVGAEVIGITARGESTIEMLGLDRLPLRNERKSWLTWINILLLLAISAEATIKIEARDHLIWMMQKDAPYTALTRAYLLLKCPKLAHPEQPHPDLAETNRLERIAELVARNKDRVLDLC